MLNSILNQHKDPVKFDNIKLNQEVITDPSDIKSHIQQHFNNWTALRPIDQNIFTSDWQSEYDPKPHILQEWYQNALANLSQEEILSTLSQLPNNKACGPSGISYEMLKHAGSKFLLAITILFNRCLISQTIPKQ